MKILSGVICFLLCVLQLSAQIVNEAAFSTYEHQKAMYQKGSGAHTAFKPTFLDSSLQKFPLVISRTPSANFHISPVLDLFYGVQNEESKTVYGRGLGLALDYRGKKWNSGFTYLRQNARYMNYQREFIRENRVVPGMNVASGKTLVSSDYIAGFLNFSPNEIFEFEIGYGKQFIGDGYRSLLRSDAANSSPYLKITTNFWKIQYTNLFTSHQNIFNVEGERDLYEKKYSATHFLDWNVSKWLSIGLFETIVWQAKEGNYTRGFDANYANPFIFYRPVEFSVGSSDNALVGANIKMTPFKNHSFYAQLVFDEFLLEELKADLDQWRNKDQDIQSGWWANKYGVQVGWTAFDLMKIKGLQTRVEFNLVRPYTYAHSSPTQAYSNYNISLAHPLGANFHEFVSIVDYRKKKWNLRLQFNQSRKGLSTGSENLGDNIQVSNRTRAEEYENNLAQGTPVFTQYAETSVGYLFNEFWNMTASLGYIWREQKVDKVAHVNNMIVLRLKTNLYNQYFDY